MSDGHSYQSQPDNQLLLDVNKFAQAVMEPGYAVERGATTFFITGTLSETKLLTGVFTPEVIFDPQDGFFAVSLDGRIVVGNKININSRVPGPLILNPPAPMNCYVSQWRF